jgi:large subunit ribosomal protein L23
MLKPVFTEKSLKQARDGKYTFWVGMGMEKPKIKADIAKAFGVHVTGVKTVVGHSESRRNTKGQKFLTKGVKKAIVTLKSGEKIDIFEETKSK